MNDSLPSDWNPKQMGDRVLANLVNICLPGVKGAHDSDFLILDGTIHRPFDIRSEVAHNRRRQIGWSSLKGAAHNGQ